MGEKSPAHARALWNCGRWCSSILVVTLAAAVVDVGDAEDVGRDVFGGNDKSGATVTLADTEWTDKVREQREREEALPVE